MNKSQFIEALAANYEGDKKAASRALGSVVDMITRQVAKGEKVAITGFGAFEKTIRPSRMVRNPATGQRVRAKKSAVPKFRAGADFKNVVSGAKKLPKLSVAKPSSPAKKSTSSSQGTTKKAAKSTAARTSSGRRTTKAAAARKAPAKKTAASRTPARKSTATKSAAKRTAAKKTAAKKTTAKKTTAASRSAARRTTTAKKAPAKRTAKKS